MEDQGKGKVNERKETIDNLLPCPGSPEKTWSQYPIPPPPPPPPPAPRFPIGWNIEILVELLPFERELVAGEHRIHVS